MVPTRNLHVPDRNGMVIALDSPRYFDNVSTVGDSVLRPDHQTDRIRLGLDGSFAIAARVAEIAVAA